ncbi:hypothetical protein BGLA2_1170026 [Burkholderia gladioli]|nr:hypothetical protein BGLA2_1170026 [Burkholderia gladioli]
MCNFFRTSVQRGKEKFFEERG